MALSTVAARSALPLCRRSAIRRFLSSSPAFEMSEEERYFFDLNGYIVVRNVLTPEEVSTMNSIIDNRSSQMIERREVALRNTQPHTAFSGTGPGRLDLGGVLEWGPDSRLFKSILAHPHLLRFFHTLLGKGYRMDHLPFVIASEQGGEGFQLHGGTIDCLHGTYNPHLAYTCVKDLLRCALLGCNVMLVDHGPNDGGFCVVPGSHKSNFQMPPGLMDGEGQLAKECIVQPETRAGDVVLFSEGTVHGAMAWNGNVQRRTCLYRFSPCTNVYGRSYIGGWPEKMYEDLDDAQRSVLEPPYANRLDRPNICEDGVSVEITTRSERKKQHDADVFKTKYF